jgi:transcriptional regulator with XRE-family HTH domain
MPQKDLRAVFGMRVRLLGVERGWSQEKHAERCDLDRNYVGSIEREAQAAH